MDYWKGLLSVLAATLLCAGHAQGALVAGDVVILGVNSDNPDAFAWAPLVDLRAGQQLYFTDSGWIGGAFSGSQGASSDGALLLEVPTGGIRAGTMLGGDGRGYNSEYAMVSGAAGSRFSLLSSGDQLAVFTGSMASPEFLFALNFAGAGWDLAGGSSSNNVRSELYPGLVDGRTAVAIGTGPRQGQEYDNARYDGSLSGTREQLLRNITNPSLWVGNDLSGASDRFEPLVAADRLSIESMEVQAVPEPTSLFCWSAFLGLGGVVGRRRRRRNS